MEQQQWPTKFQQSGASEVDEKDTIMNSSNSSENLLQLADNKVGNNEETCDQGVRLQQKCENEISEKSKSKIQAILNEVNMLSSIEKLLLYLKLPTESKESVDPLRQPLNPLGSRSEINQTIMWIKTHLEEDPDLSLQKRGVYNEYKTFCEQNKIKTLSTADFGKVMKQVYPKVRPRRLGTRGNSQYCYSGLRNRIKLAAPLLPDLSDKPLSTESSCHTSDLMSAAWIIIKEWSECQLGIKFESIQTLAYHLVTKSSIGSGSKSAALVTANIEKQIKAEAVTSYSSKHKEMTIQLQRKIQQKNEISKDQKRKLQSPRNELKSRNKKGKVQQQISTTSTSSPTAANGNNNTSPSQGLQTVCDKSLDFTNLQTLPDFSSFQKPVSDMGNSCDVTVREDNGFGNVGSDDIAPAPKVAIPRLTVKQSPVPSRRGRNAKYKAIQPKPEPCDIVYNPQLTNTTAAGDTRSQETSTKLRKQKKESDMDIDSDLIEDQQALILSRERLISVSKVSKDALDGYLGTENSQEHEEELMKYFENNNSEETPDPDKKKLSQLRQLLEQNQMQELHPPNNVNVDVAKPVYGHHYVPKMERPFHINTSGNSKRRVSFDTQVHDDSVPPSPNTRRKNFSFTPISPGPHSPNGRQSKCSSTNASPFVSPRNTPVPRARGNSHPYSNQTSFSTTGRKQLKNIRVKHDLDLGLDYKPQVAMSAPPSPKTNVLHDLLNNKVSYPTEYAQSQMSSEVSLLLANNVTDTPAENYRSQSVPVSTIPYLAQFSFDSNAATQNEFNVTDSFSTSESINVNKIIATIDDAPLNIIENNEIVFGNAGNDQDDFCSEFNKQPSFRWGNRSQSFDYDAPSVSNTSKCPPYRSVPSTPVPYSHPKVEPEKNFAHNSRSYPSTPLTNETFTYNPGHDYLLNGQPIKEKPSSIDINHTNYFGADNKFNCISEIFNDTNVSGDGFIPDTKTNFNFDGQMGDNFETKGISVEDNCDIIAADYFKGDPDVNGS